MSIEKVEKGGEEFTSSPGFPIRSEAPQFGSNSAQRLKLYFNNVKQGAPRIPEGTRPGKILNVLSIIDGDKKCIPEDVSSRSYQHTGSRFSISNPRLSRGPERTRCDEVRYQNKLAEDYKDYCSPEKKGFTMKALETIITGNNAAFHNAFMTEWNSGATSRDYESYCRQLRQSMGRNNYYRSKDFVVKDRDSAVERVEDYFISKNWQIVFGSEEFFWVMYVQNNIPILFGEVKMVDHLLTATFEGDKKDIVLALEELGDLFKRGEGVPVANLLQISKFGFSTKLSYLFHEDHLVAKDHFYPWLNRYGDSLEELYDEYLNSSKNVLLLIGPPGGGKTTFLRTIILRARRANNFICNNEHVLVGEEFIPWLHGREDGSLIAIEDADNFVSARDKTDNNSMAGLLNIADGIVPRKSKIIVSTNLASISKVDAALLRPGRCHKVLEFRNLTYNEACQVREIEGLSRLALDTKAEYSLAEVLCGEDLADINTRKRTSIGFFK